ncbi:hypothetical protein PSPO01_03027 [Paraphaeosphaeria sporulosa]
MSLRSRLRHASITDVRRVCIALRRRSAARASQNYCLACSPCFHVTRLLEAFHTCTQQLHLTAAHPTPPTPTPHPSATSLSFSLPAQRPPYDAASPSFSRGMLAARRERVLLVASGSAGGSAGVLPQRSAVQRGLRACCAVRNVQVRCKLRVCERARVLDSVRGRELGV